MKALLMLALLALPLAANAQSRDKLVDQYSDFAGSKANSTSLVDGMRNGTQVKFSDGTTFTPPTGKMGNGNVHIALAMAQEDLKKQGITKPTPSELRDELTRILQERADHKGWGAIAQERGFKVGDLMRPEKANDNAKDHVARADKPERLEKPERAERPEKPERPERPDRSGRGPH